MAHSADTYFDGTEDRDVYLNFVDTLFADGRSIVFGVLLQLGVSIAILYDTNDLNILYFMLGMISAAILRLHFVRRYRDSDHRNSADPINGARRWEKLYTALAFYAAIIPGLLSFYEIAYVKTEFPVIASCVIIFATIPTISGRLYGSMTLAHLITLALLVPPTFGLLLRGDIGHWVLACLMPPYFLLMNGIVKNIRKVVARAVLGSKAEIEIAKRLDSALNNMSHGLIMFDEDDRILLINAEARTLFAIPDHVKAEGRHFGVLLRYGSRYGRLTKSKAERMNLLVKQLLEKREGQVQFRTNDRRFLEFSATVREGGGTVLVVEDVSARVNAARKIERMAQFDSLTNLPNRGHFEDLVARELTRAKKDERFALMVIDIDDFKHVNDAIGHAQGDALLKSVAAKLASLPFKNFITSRLGGDEFLVFFSGLTAGTELDNLAEKVWKRVSGVHRLGIEQVHVSCSIGVHSCETGDCDLEKSLIRADIALYHSKARGKGNWSVFNPEMDEKYMRRQRMKADLAKAVENRDLITLYQPIIDAKSGRMVACEALSRWHHANYGNVSPAEYIPLAEEMGIISAISEQVLEQAISDCKRWGDSVAVSVNLSPIDFKRLDVAAVIGRLLKSYDLESCRLEIEVTETAVISNEAEMISKLRSINEMGVRISLDDFGTGYSALSYLHKLPLNKVKIDRSFVVGIETGTTPIALLQGVTRLCRMIGLAVTVEGLESERQLQLVLATGNVDRIQGFIYGAALPASAICELARLTKIPLKNTAQNTPIRAAG